mgnify:CR=1 FL=1
MEQKNIAVLPANYTDGGKLFGILPVRNAVEAVIAAAVVGFAEYALIPMSGSVRAVVMAVTLLPLVILFTAGVDGGSLSEFCGYVLRFLMRRRVYCNEGMCHADGENGRTDPH